MYYKEVYDVQSLDADINDHIKPHILIRYMQEAANHQMRDRKPTYYELFDDGKSFIMTRMAVRIFGQVHQYDKLEVRTWTAGERGATFYRNYEAYVEGELMARAVGEWVIIGIEDQKIFRVSEVDFSNYEADELIDIPMNRKFQMPSGADFIDAGEKLVEYSDCDMNLHMNNTVYTKMIWDRIEDIKGKEVTSVNLRFRTEAPLGSSISVTRAEVTPEYINDEDAEEAYAFKTFVDGKVNLEALIGVRETDSPLGII